VARFETKNRTTTGRQEARWEAKRRAFRSMAVVFEFFWGGLATRRARAARRGSERKESTVCRKGGSKFEFVEEARATLSEEGSEGKKFERKRREEEYGEERDAMSSRTRIQSFLCQCEAKRRHKVGPPTDYVKTHFVWGERVREERRAAPVDGGGKGRGDIRNGGAKTNGLGSDENRVGGGALRRQSYGFIWERK
jgi:hypothetical protein